NRAWAIGVHPDEGAVCVGVHARAEGHRAEIDEFAPGDKSVLDQYDVNTPAHMPADSPFSQETALLGNCERKSFFVAVDDADREQDQREAVIHDQILEPNVVRNGDGFLRPSAADLSRRAGFKMALYEKIFFMFRVREQDQDRGVRKMEIMEGLDQFFLFDDGGMRDGLEELPVEEKPQRPKAAFSEGLKALCIHGKTVIRSLFAHPHARFENAMSQETVPSGVDAPRAATGACGPCRQRVRCFLSRYV
ncbi:MAG: hypothetical protein AABZ14_05575, partial [Candidatus Margulisiibacteriota bacterium]